MPAQGNLGKQQVGAAAAHLFGSGAAQHVRRSPPDQRQRQPHTGIEQRPELGQRASQGRIEGDPQGGIIGQPHAIVALNIVTHGFFLPAQGGNAVKPRHGGLHPVGHLVQCRHCRVDPDKGSDPQQAVPFQDRANVVQAKAQQAVLRGGGNHHPEQPAARRPDDRGPVQTQMIQQRKGIRRLLPYGIGCRPGPVRSATAAAVQPDQAHIRWKMLRQIIEVATVTGQPCQSQQRQPVAVIAIGKLCPVCCLERPHPSFPSGQSGGYSEKPLPVLRPRYPAETICLSRGLGRYFGSSKPLYRVSMMFSTTSRPIRSPSASGPIG